MKEDEAARESKSDKVKDEFDKVKDDLLLWIKEAPVLKFRNLKPDEFKKTWHQHGIFLLTTERLLQCFRLMGQIYEWIVSWQVFVARICDGFAGKPLGKDVQHRQNLCEWFHRQRYISQPVS